MNDQATVFILKIEEMLVRWMCGTEIAAFIHFEASSFVSNWLEFKFFIYNISVSVTREKEEVSFCIHRPCIVPLSIPY